MKTEETLPEAILLHAARGGRPENTAGAGNSGASRRSSRSPSPPAPKVLYAGLCSFLGYGQINRKNLRNTLKDRTD